jgi:hypothetical protein
VEKPPVVRVPKAARSSYQPHRPLHKNVLLLNQVKHFREIEKDLPAKHQAGTPIESIQTEAQAAEYIRHITKKLHRLSKRPKHA